MKWKLNVLLPQLPNLCRQPKLNGQSEALLVIGQYEKPDRYVQQQHRVHRKSFPTRWYCRAHERIRRPRTPRQRNQNHQAPEQLRVIHLAH